MQKLHPRFLLTKENAGGCRSGRGQKTMDPKRCTFSFRSVNYRAGKVKSLGFSLEREIMTFFTGLWPLIAWI